MSVDAGFEAAQAAIVAGTYEGFAPEAVGLYQDVMSMARRCVEPVDFGYRAFDVGSRDERHRPVVVALGPSEVIGIEPNKRETARAVAFGVAEAGDVFSGSLQEWADTTPAPADSAFLFNVLRRLIEDRDFMRALRNSVAVGGIAVVSFMRSDADQDFIDSLPERFAGFRRIEVAPSEDVQSGRAIPRQRQIRNTSLSIWRRED